MADQEERGQDTRAGWARAGLPAPGSAQTGPCGGRGRKCCVRCSSNLNLATYRRGDLGPVHLSELQLLRL